MIDRGSNLLCYLPKSEMLRTTLGLAGATIVLLLCSEAAFVQAVPQLIMGELFPIERPAHRPDGTLREPSTVSAAQERPLKPPVIPFLQRLFGGGLPDGSMIQVGAFPTE